MKNSLMLLFLLVFVGSGYAQDKKPVDCSVAEIDSLWEIFDRQRAYDKFIPYAQVGVEKAAKQYGKQDPTYAKMLSLLGESYCKKQDFVLAEKYLQQAIAIQKMKNPKSTDYAQSLHSFGIFYYSKGNYVLAEPLFIQVKDIRKDLLGEKHPSYARSLNSLGVLYMRMGNYALAELLYKESTNIFKEVLGSKHPSYASSLSNLAVLYYTMDNYILAEALYKEGLKIQREVLGEKHPDYASSLTNLAILYNTIGNDSLAKTLHNAAVSIKKEVFGDKHPSYANGLSGLAILYKDMGSYTLGVPLYKEALKIYGESLGDKHPAYAHSLNDLAILYFNMGNDAASWNYIQQAINANSGLNISLNITKPWADSLIAVDYSSIDEMTRTLNILYDLLLTDSIAQIDTKNNGKEAKTIIVADLALKLLQKSRDNFSEEADKLRTLSETSDWVLRGLAVLDKNAEAEKCFALAEQSKSVLLLDAAQTAMAQSFGDLPDSLVQVELQLQKQKSGYEAGIVEKRPESEIDSLRRLLNNLNLDIKAFKTGIEKSFPKYAALKYQHNDVEAKDVQKLLDDKTALLEYVIGDSVVYVFYVDKKQVKLNSIYISTKVLAAKIKEFHGLLSNYELAVKDAATSYQKYTENAHWFFQNLVAPALKGRAIQATDIKNLIIVSDGELGHLPFEAFLVESAPQAQTDYNKLHYLINDYKISYNYSATIWKSSKESVKNKNNGQLLAMASNYDIKMDSTKIDWRLPVHQRLREGLGILPAARKEVETLAASFNGFFGFDKDASEKNFKEKAGDYAVIHLAMHGLLDAKSLILSSLAFTEDGDSLENNFLHAYEISKMKLNADLVVLSACETGYGRFDKGNGIASLAQAFAYAGAPAMIVSLWQVNDYATSEIMKNLYQNLADGMEKDAALQEAKLKYMKEAEGIAAHPAFWSAFVLMGNSDGITLGRTHVFAPTWIIGIALAVLGGIAFAIRRKKKE